MKILAVLITTGLMVFLGRQAVTLHRLTVCRQEAWRSSLILHTHTLLSEVNPSEKDILTSCRLIVRREKNAVSWTRLPVARHHQVPLHLQGKI